jgi:hypothetical protein
MISFELMEVLGVEVRGVEVDTIVTMLLAN